MRCIVAAGTVEDGNRMCASLGTRGYNRVLTYLFPRWRVGLVKSKNE